MSARPDEFAGQVIITWPKANGFVAGYGIVLTDADTDEQIMSALNGEMTIRMDAKEIVTVELTMLTDADGKPLARGAKPVVVGEGDDAELATSRFRWAVAEMRIAE